MNVWLIIKYSSTVMQGKRKLCECHSRIFFFAGKKLTPVNYLDMLENFVFLQLEGLQPHVFLQQDGAQLHWDAIVRSSLDDYFTERWIGQGGPISFDNGPPDATSLDFFLRGFVKDIVYRRKISNVDDLKARAAAAVAFVNVDMHARIWRKID